MQQKYRGVLNMFQRAKMFLDFLIIYSRWKFFDSFLFLILHFVIIIITITITITIVLCLILHPFQQPILSSVYLYGLCSQSCKCLCCFHGVILILTTSTSELIGQKLVTYKIKRTTNIGVYFIFFKGENCAYIS